jgi:hypothetical protein
MPRFPMSTGPSRILALALAAAGLAVLLLIVRRRRRRSDRGGDEPGEDIGYGPTGAAVAAPEPVDLGGDIPPRPAPGGWDDLSTRRRLPVGEYRAAPDEPDTEPEEAP